MKKENEVETRLEVIKSFLDGNLDGLDVYVSRAKIHTLKIKREILEWVLEIKNKK